MAEETHISDMRRAPNRRKLGKKKGGKGKKNVKMPQGSARKAKIDPKMKKLFRRRARDYNSDDDEDQLDDQSTVNMPRGSARNIKIDPKMKMFRKRAREHNSDSEEEVDIKERSEPLDEEVSSEEMEDKRDNYMDAEDGNSDEYGDIQPGVTKLTEGCRAFKMAFKSIMKRTVGDETLGPVLSAHKKLVIEKLAEEEAERKIKGEAKKEKHLVAEKGHVKPANYLDSHEKFLIGVATKGVVKLFNAVNKAQSAQKGLNPSRSSDAKVIKKRRKEAFFSELGKKSSNASTKDNLPKGETGEGPSWAPLRDNYMLTNSKLKDWDKKPDTLVEDDIGRMSEDSSSDDD